VRESMRKGLPASSGPRARHCSASQRPERIHRTKARRHNCKATTSSPPVSAELANDMCSRIFFCHPVPELHSRENFYRIVTERFRGTETGTCRAVYRRNFIASFANYFSSREAAEPVVLALVYRTFCGYFVCL